jgi:hypothetical protein
VVRRVKVAKAYKKGSASIRERARKAGKGNGRDKGLEKEWEGGKESEG